MQGVRMGCRAWSGDPVAFPEHDPSTDQFPLVMEWNQATAAS